MSDSRNALSLLGTDGREKRPGADEQDALQFSGSKPFVHSAGKYGTRAAAAAAARVGILAAIKDHTATVIISAIHGITLFSQHFSGNPAANAGQVSRKNSVIMIRSSPGI